MERCAFRHARRLPLARGVGPRRDADEAWRVASSVAVHGLVAWRPPLPPAFLAPDHVAAFARGEA